MKVKKKKHKKHSHHKLRITESKRVDEDLYLGINVRRIRRSQKGWVKKIGKSQSKGLRIAKAVREEIAS